MALRAELRSPRTTGMSPASHIAQPRQGTRNREALASHFISQGTCEMRNGSVCEQWLLTTTVRVGQRAGRGPWMPKSHRGVSGR
jgi:hypothetical protein